MNAHVLVLNEEEFRRTLREEFQAMTASQPDNRTADAHRNKLPGSEKEWLTNKEACKYLGLSRMTLQRYRDNGVLEFSKVGSNIYYRRADILALLEKNAQLSLK